MCAYELLCVCNCLMTSFITLDIDECTTGVHNCKPNERCVNKPGWFSCECTDGYELMNDMCEGID